MNTQLTHRIAQVLGASGETGELVLRCADGGVPAHNDTKCMHGVSRYAICDVCDSPVPNVLNIFTAPAAEKHASAAVDCLGLALDLESEAKKVSSQTAERAMRAAANGLRIILAAPAAAIDACEQEDES